MRLVEGNITSGRVEVYLNGEWGTVCDDFWSLEDAEVVCRQLGFPGAVTWLRAAGFGEGEGRIHLDDVECVGDETDILDCPSVRQPNCNHGEDAGVICIPNEDEIGNVIQSVFIEICIFIDPHLYKCLHYLIGNSK